MRTARIAGVLLAGIALPALAQMNPGQVRGTLSDEQGQPIAGVKLRFEAEADAATGSPTLKVDKKGKFSQAFFPAGSYSLTLEDPKLALRSMVYVLGEVSGIVHDRKEVDAASGQPWPRIVVEPGMRVELTLVAGPSAVAAAESAAVSGAGKLRRAADLYADGDMEGVIAAANEVLATEPALADALYLRGVAAWRLGRLPEAEQDLRAAVGAVPDQPGIWQTYGTVLLDRATALEQGADAASAAKLASEAADAFAEELERNPGNLKALTNRAVAVDKAGRTDELEPALRALLQADPANEPARSRLARLLQETGRSAEALALLGQSATGGHSAAQVFNVAVGLYNEGKLDEAFAAAQQALQLDPALPQPHRLLGRIHLAKGDNAAAILALEKYLAMAPEAPDAAAERQLLESLKKASR